MVNRDVSIVVRAVDKASKEMKGIGRNLSGFARQHQKTFRNMALVGTAAFAGIAAGVNKATQSAAAAEGTWNKFNTVFADGADEMRDFVDDIRTRMPVASDNIARMGADMQDLLVPMGLARDEAMGLTQQSLELANQLAAFNDVDPTEVLEAMKSGFTGMSQPLKKFGIDASQSAIELEAQNMGLIGVNESLQSLNPEIRRSVQAQALMSKMMKDSGDAIEGFDANADSLLFRQMELKASVEDLVGILGKSFVPILDNIVKSITPVLRRVTDWIEANPELTKNIILITGGVAGLVAVVGTLGLALPAIISGFGILGSVIFAVASPITILTALIAGLAYYIITNRTEISTFWINVRDKISNYFVDVWDKIGDTVLKGVRIIAAVITGGMSEVAIIIYKNRGSIRERLQKQFNIIIEGFRIMGKGIMIAVEFITKLLDGEFNLWGGFIDWLGDKVYWLADTVFGYFSDRIKRVLESVTKAWNKITGLVGRAGTTIRDAGSSVVSSITGGRQFGGTMLANKSYLVGERGPEIVTPSRTTKVNPNIASSSPTININMGGVTVSNQADENRLIEKLKRELINETRRFNYGIV